MGFDEPDGRNHVHHAHPLHRASSDGTPGDRRKNHHFSVPPDNMDVRRRMFPRRQQDAHPESIDLEDGWHHGKINPTAGLYQSGAAAGCPVCGVRYRVRAVVDTVPGLEPLLRVAVTLTENRTLDGDRPLASLQVLRDPRLRSSQKVRGATIATGASAAMLSRSLSPVTRTSA